MWAWATSFDLFGKKLRGKMVGGPRLRKVTGRTAGTSLGARMQWEARRPRHPGLDAPRTRYPGNIRTNPSTAC